MYCQNKDYIVKYMHNFGKRGKIQMIKTILGIIYPTTCIFCDKILEKNKELEICEECYKELKFLDNGKTIHKNNDEIYYDDIFAAFKYSGKIKELIIKYKYQHKGYLFRAFSKLMFKSIKDRKIDADIILSVPLYKDRERQRGYNQAHLLAKEMSRLTNIQYDKKILRRVKTTNCLALCNKKERKDIIKGAFLLKNPEKVKNKKIILIDDVFTTGATINECSKVLKQCGAKKIIGLVIAKTII